MVTYLLGAGASANALPVVKGFKERFRLFINDTFSLQIVNEQISTIAGIEPKLNGNDFFVNQTNSLLNHFTPDTFARKVFLEKGIDSIEYKSIKRIISTYFLWEQFKKDSFNIPFIFDDSDVINYKMTLEKRIKEILDYRYDVFCATLLQKNPSNDLILPKDVNIISWNYDWQIEKSIQQYSTGKMLSEVLKQNNIYKLNGTANFKLNNRKQESIKEFEFDEYNYNSDETKTLLLDINKGNKDKELTNLLSFAWENKDDSIITNSINALKQSNCIVIIGYSFPYFNRVVDRRLFKAIDNKKIVLQYPSEEEYLQARSNIEELIPPNSQCKIIPKLSVEQFYIPEELIV